MFQHKMSGFKHRFRQKANKIALKEENSSSLEEKENSNYDDRKLSSNQNFMTKSPVIVFF